jgi:5-formyltetrahydrofolate cyclo-ligase
MLKYRIRIEGIRISIPIGRETVRMSSERLPISEQKTQLRKRITAERSALSEELRNQKSEIICKRAIENIQALYNGELLNNFVLYTYIPFRAELNVMPIVEWCWENGIRVAAPRVVPLIRELNFHYIKGYEDLQLQPPWGIYEPLVSNPLVEYKQQSGCVLVPGVAFDLNKARMGYGGGYYDKFLQQMNEWNITIYKLALALDMQIVHEVPCELHDIAVDKLITETRVI